MPWRSLMFWYMNCWNITKMWKKKCMEKKIDYLNNSIHPNRCSTLDPVFLKLKSTFYPPKANIFHLVYSKSPSSQEEPLGYAAECFVFILAPNNAWGALPALHKSWHLFACERRGICYHQNSDGTCGRFTLNFQNSLQTQFILVFTRLYITINFGMKWWAAFVH